MEISRTLFIYQFIVVLFLVITKSFGNDSYVNPSGIPANAKFHNVFVDKDNHKPEFKGCINYKAFVKEEQPRGTFVYNITAEDVDPKDAGGSITYSIIRRDGERQHFTVDNRTGKITTNDVFDRDEPSRQKELYVTVKAADNGRPVLADICTFKVTVEDINDNAPQFDKLEYKEHVSVDLPIRGEVIRVFAYDFDDGDNSRLTYSLNNTSNNEMSDYFEIDNKTGVIYLKKSLADKKQHIFRGKVVVRDNGLESKEASADIDIQVIESNKKPPTFSEYPNQVIYLPENFNDFEHKIAIFKANSGIPRKSLQFELIKGKTSQTNKDVTFQLTQEGETEAYITLGRLLDYEKITNYQLTVRITNKDSLSFTTTFEVQVEDVNDEIPTFIELVSGSVLENEEPGAQVMQVRAIDKDGTSANNVVSYELSDEFKDLFEIDRNTGKVTTRKKFNREEQEVFDIKVIAKDNSPSALKTTKDEPNSATQVFRITIEDRNDNPPQFTNSSYIARNVLETTDTGITVIEVKARDLDTASLITYSIINGNVDDAFEIEAQTGRIKVKNKLDFEKIEVYNLTVRAHDGIYEDEANVIINIGNVNDENPVFTAYNKNISMKEETLGEGCILNLEAYDPDIKDRTAPQNIIYKVDDTKYSFISVNENGCVTLVKKLDRDKPNGFPKYQAYVYAYDDNGGPNAQLGSAEIIITLTDINDNAPFLTVTEQVWYENQPAGEILHFKAEDYDSDENGPPFTYALDDSASEDISNKFSVVGDTLRAEVTFDREQQKYYMVPIAITDSGNPTMTGTSYIKVIIGDRNDNEAKDGYSEIFVYNYNGLSPDVAIGRVYVEDLDDWDLDDKTFQWDSHRDENFELNHDNGTITMKKGTPEGNFLLNFDVTEEARLIAKHTVKGTVKVTVKTIPTEAVKKSGSIRLEGTTVEDFIVKTGNVSRKDVLQQKIAKILNTSLDNVDVFTVIPSPTNSSFVDVRFSAHGSPYYLPERLNARTSDHQQEIERDLGVKILMISINECLEESICAPGVSCNNRLNIKDEPAVVFTNQTSFVGVQAVVEPVCNCELHFEKQCYNGGTLLEDSVCSCPEGFDGPRCELLGIAFSNDGWAMYPAFEACNNSEIRLEISPQQEDGLIFYAGPMSTYPAPAVKDFISLELDDGYPVLLVDYGTGTTKIQLKYKKLTDGAQHSVRILLQPDEIQISVDDCHQSACMALGDPPGDNKLLNVNGPLQVGGTKGDLRALSTMLGWQYTPESIGFSGCIKNLTINGETYNLGMPGEYNNSYPNCNYAIARAVSFGIDSNFLVAILVCVAILLILLLAVVVHRRKQDNWNEKDSDDIRENIINYEDEGGGEVDTGFDMSVLQPEFSDKDPTNKQILYKSAPEVPDINGFLVDKKDNCDRDPNNMPYDDVRYYAYEGDGNSTGSLSSLASCTDEGDLKFNYLSNFGPRFRKLADMYGEDPSDEDSQDGGEESWC